MTNVLLPTRFPSCKADKKTLKQIEDAGYVLVKVHEHDPVLCPSHVNGCTCADLENWSCNPHQSDDSDFCPDPLYNRAEIEPAPQEVSA